MNEVPHFHYERVSSTNDVAKELLATNSRLFVSADHQYSGRGRKGRQWQGDSHKNIYLSYAVNETKHSSIKNKALYQIIGSLAVEKTLATLVTPDTIRLKYPNDVYVLNANGEYRKIAGILSEHSYMGSHCTESILGIGINVNQERFDDTIANKATSLRLLAYDCNMEQLVEELKRNILQLLDVPEEAIFGKWKQHINLLGKKVRLVGTDAEYRVESINNDGSLNAANQNGNIIINNGDSIVYEL